MESPAGDLFFFAHWDVSGGRPRLRLKPIGYYAEDGPEETLVGEIAHK
jgi:hypothetical protein